MLSIKPIEALSDNYIWLVTTNEGSIVIDPGESKQIIDLVKSNEIDLEVEVLSFIFTQKYII